MINEAALQKLKEQYPPGTNVVLVSMSDSQAPPIGSKGIVDFIDDLGTIHVKWENGANLGVIYDVDKCKRI